MNQLSTEQIQFIQERLLQKYDLKYKEIRDELLDHIACEIEEKMDQGETYEEAIILVFRKWNVRLISDKKGVYKGIPHFIVNQLNQEYRKVELKLVGLTMILVLTLVLGELYLNLNKIQVLSSLFVINGAGLCLMLRELRELNDYRLDFFKGKGLSVLLKTAIALVGVLVPHIVWGTEANTLSFDMLIVFYFLVNTYLLYRFREYCKYQKFKIAK